MKRTPRTYKSYSPSLRSAKQKVSPLVQTDSKKELRRKITETLFTMYT